MLGDKLKDKDLHKRVRELESRMVELEKRQDRNETFGSRYLMEPEVTVKWVIRKILDHLNLRIVPGGGPDLEEWDSEGLVERDLDE